MAMRRLEVAPSGYWYTALTIALGVVALISSNNVLYLIESLLLSGMIFSGLLSERSISAIELEIYRTKATAGVPTGDSIRVRNRRNFPLFCIEIGEWRQKKFIPLAFVARVPARGELLVASSAVCERRGLYRWEGLVIATSYPFGLVRKLRIIEAADERVIWPERSAAFRRQRSGDDQRGGVLRGQDFAEGEIRPYNIEDDCRNIIWTQSMRGMGPYVRVRNTSQKNLRVYLDVCTDPGATFELEVKKAAQEFHPQDEAAQLATLVVREFEGSRVIRGRGAVLDALAVVQAVGNRERS